MNFITLAPGGATPPTNTQRDNIRLALECQRMLPVIALTAPPTGATTALEVGQRARVTTTQGSITYRDIWTCSGVSPYTWEPPGHILRSPTGILIRQIVSDDGVPSTAPAYP